MRKFSIFDVKKKLCVRPLQNGDINVIDYYKNICYQCHKPFNTRKNRKRSVPVVFGDGNQYGVFLCARCAKNLNNDSRMVSCNHHGA